MSYDGLAEASPFQAEDAAFSYDGNGATDTAKPDSLVTFSALLFVCLRSCGTSAYRPLAQHFFSRDFSVAQ
jgi:hypothetical protein